MFNSKIDFLAIGDITTDAFIRLKEAKTHCGINESNCEITLKFADKIPFESSTIVKAVGNSANASVAASRLGLSSALVTDIGADDNGRECLQELKRNKVLTKYVTAHHGHETNYHYVLWYEAERTILVKHQEYPYELPKINPPSWVYLSSLANNSENYHREIVDWLIAHPMVRLAFQPGTFQMRLGAEKLSELYKRTEVFVVNVEEAQRILNTTETDKKNLLKRINELGPRIVCISDGPRGAYLYDSTKDENEVGGGFYFMPIYPDPKPPLERTGCGDAFASTFVCALIFGKTPLEAIQWGPINSMSVVQYIGAQQGLLTRTALEKFLAEAPADYKPVKI